MESWSVAEVFEFLVENDFDEEVVELFRCNKIRGKVFNGHRLAGNGPNCPAIGDRRLLNHLLQQVTIYIAIPYIAK